MTWIEPKTDWSPADRMTLEDINRMASNINEVSSGTLRTGWSQNDIIALADWQELTETLRLFLLAFGVTESFEDTADYNTFNHVEEATLLAYNLKARFAAQKVSTAYAGDALWSSEIPDTYTRGF